MQSIGVFMLIFDYLVSDMGSTGLPGGQSKVLNTVSHWYFQEVETLWRYRDWKLFVACIKCYCLYVTYLSNSHLLVMAKDIPLHARHPFWYPLVLCLWLQSLEDKFPITLTQWPLPRNVQSRLSICYYMTNCFFCFCHFLKQIPKDCFESPWPLGRKDQFSFSYVDIESLLVVFTFKNKTKQNKKKPFSSPLLHNMPEIWTLRLLSC